MTTSLDCVPCLIRQALDAARAVSRDPLLHEQILRDVLRMIAGADLKQPPPVLGQRMYQRLRELTGISDPYEAAKDRHNRVALGLLPELSAKIEAAADPFELAARLAAAGNVIDLGAKGGLGNGDVKLELELALTDPFIGDLDSFRAATAAAGDILYLADNAGEIVLDRLLIEQLPAGSVTLAVRGGPVINDATLADAHAAGLDGIAEVTDNGSDAPGTVLEDCSAEFRARFQGADMIISKGQGNFETLSSVEGNIFFLLKIKCPVVAAQTGLELGSQALIHHRTTGGKR
jgi:damage-control phosphatase, subfamily I